MARLARIINATYCRSPQALVRCGTEGPGAVRRLGAAHQERDAYWEKADAQDCEMLAALVHVARDGSSRALDRVVRPEEGAAVVKLLTRKGTKACGRNHGEDQKREPQQGWQCRHQPRSKALAAVASTRNKPRNKQDGNGHRGEHRRCELLLVRTKAYTLQRQADAAYVDIEQLKS